MSMPLKRYAGCHRPAHALNRAQQKKRSRLSMKLSRKLHHGNNLLPHKLPYNHSDPLKPPSVPDGAFFISLGVPRFIEPYGSSLITRKPASYFVERAALNDPVQQNYWRLLPVVLVVLVVLDL